MNQYQAELTSVVAGSDTQVFPSAAQQLMMLSKMGPPAMQPPQTATPNYLMTADDEIEDPRLDKTTNLAMMALHKGDEKVPTTLISPHFSTSDR